MPSRDVTTVAMLFADIEGSTGLVQQLGSEWLDVLTTQRRLCRAAWAVWGGREMGTEGDSFFVVFDEPRDAVSAALEAQESLADYRWPLGVSVRVRIGVHAGPAVLHESGYVGLEVHRAARVAGAAHGGQTLVTAETMSAIGVERLPARLLVKDLGRQQLKDLPTTEALVQVATPGLGTDFPPPRTAQGGQGRAALIGREREMAESSALVESSPGRLVTLTGPGGIGKTTLAVAVGALLAPAYTSGCVLVALAAETDNAAAWARVLEATNSQEESDLDDLDAVLVLDNLEQLVDATGLVSRLLMAAPKARVLATSRSNLGLVTETEYHLAPLSLPDRDGTKTVEASAAVQLFTARATAVNPKFTLEPYAEAVAEVCRRVDGLPLAIELVAARSRVLTPDELLDRLGYLLDFSTLAAEAPARHASLRATIAWSVDLLSQRARELLTVLGAFAAEAEIPAIEAVSAVTPAPLSGVDLIDTLDELVEASLIDLIVGRPTSWSGPEPSRVVLLQTVAEFASDQLSARPHCHDVLLAHAEYLRSSAGTARDLDVRHAGRFYEWVLPRRTEIVAALSRTLGAVQPATNADPRTWFQVGVDLTVAIVDGWGTSSSFAEAIPWLRLICDDERTRPLDRARCYSALAVLEVRNGRAAPDGAVERVTEIVDLLVAQGLYQDAASNFLSLGWLMEMAGDVRGAHDALTRCIQLTEREGLDVYTALALSNRGITASSLGDLHGALVDSERAVDVATRCGAADVALAAAENRACGLRDLDRPQDALAEMERIFDDVLRSRGSSNDTIFLEDYACTLVNLGIHEPAALLLGSADAALRRMHARREPMQEADIAPFRESVREALGPQGWQRAYGAGTHLSLDQALRLARDTRRAPPDGHK